MLEEELINKICELGLTHRQSRIYLVIAKYKSCTVKEISEKSKVHVQDIYKILPALEKYGLVLRTINKPIKVEAIPVKIALKNWLDMQEQKLKNQKERTEEIILAINNQELPQNVLEQKLVVLNEGTKSWENMLEHVFMKAKKSYDSIFSESVFIKALPFYRNRLFNLLAEHNVRSQILVRKAKYNDEDLMKIITSTGLNYKNFAIKATRKNELPYYYAIIDNNEVWIVLKFNRKDSALSVLVTDNEVIVNICKNDFERFWVDPETKVLIEK